MPELIPAGPGTAEWHAARRLGVTATDIVTILGLSHWDSPYCLFWRKMGQVPDVEDNDRFRLGRDLEPIIAARWLGGGDPGWLGPSGLYRHSERAWQMATVDRIVPEVRAVSDSGPLELKSWADADRRSWDDGPPPTVRAQALWQMDVMDAAAGHVGVLFLPSGEFRSYVIEHEDEKTHLELGWPGCPVCVDQHLMLDAGEEFMSRLRLELPPPDPDSSAATLAAVRARFAKAPGKEADVDLDWWVSFDHASNQLKIWEGIRREAEIKLREQAGEASILTVDGQKVATRVVSDAQVKAHTRHVDYYRRVTVKGDDSE